MTAALAVIVVFGICLILTDVYNTRRKNERAIENMRRRRGGLGL